MVALLELGTFVAVGSTASASAGSTTPMAETAALQFLATHLASNRACVSGGMLLRVLRHLAAPPPDGTGTAGDMCEEEREAVFCDVVSAAGSSMTPVDQQQVGAAHKLVCLIARAAALANLTCCAACCCS